MLLHSCLFTQMRFRKETVLKDLFRLASSSIVIATSINLLTEVVLVTMQSVFISAETSKNEGCQFWEG